MIKKLLTVAFISLVIYFSSFGQQQLQLSNLPNNTPIIYTHDFLFPLQSELLLRNGFQLTGNQNDLDNATLFTIYYEEDTIETAIDNLVINDSLILVAGKVVQLKSGFEIKPIGTEKFIATIEKRLADYDTNTDGLQPVTEYDPDFRFRYFMSIFGPRLILRDGIYRYDFHQGSDIIDLEKPEDNVPIVDLPNFQCICDGVITEFVKLDDPADINDPAGVGRKTGIHCLGDTIVEPPMGVNTKIIEATGEGQYLVVKCNNKDQYPVSLGFSDNDIYIAYRHLYNFGQNFNIGDSIKRGDIIGKMGQTGITTNYHLHFSALRRACLEMPAKRFINVHPMYLFNPEYNPHLLRKLEVNPNFDNNSSSINHQEINPEISFLNYDTISPGANPIIRIALPYSQTSIQKVIIRDKNGIAPSNEWTFNFLERGIEAEAERDKNYWDMNGDGLADTVYIHHFNRGTSASFLFDSHDEEAHFDGHPGRDWPILSTGLYRTSAYILDFELVNYTGAKDDLEVEVVDIWNNRIKGVINVIPFHTPSPSKNYASLKSTFDFRIMPNPTMNRQIQLKLENLQGSSPININVINQLGQAIYQQKMLSNEEIQLDLGHLTKGSYWVKVKMDNHIISKQLILF